MNDDILRAIISDEMLKNVAENREFNNVILGYYDRFKNEAGVMFTRGDIEKKQKRLSSCNRTWTFDKFEVQKVKDFQRTHLCLDKFCNNCKKVKQASRMARYIPELEPFKENMFHLTLTLPNCEGTQLRYTYDNMAKAYRRLTKLLRCEYEINGIDFKKWGYKGAVRSLEVTFNGKTYHPHFHVGLVLGEGFLKDLDEYHVINDYSFDNSGGNRTLKRLFCDQEILIQKIWRLLLEGEKLTKQAIDELKIGYSCTLWRFSESDYVELFKYMTKSTDEKGSALSYNNFVHLLHGLYNVKQIQGYGCLYQIQENEVYEEYERIYETMIQELRAKENPVQVTEKLEGLLSDTEYIKISRKSYFKYLNTIETV